MVEWIFIWNMNAYLYDFYLHNVQCQSFGLISNKMIQFNVDIGRWYTNLLQKSIQEHYVVQHFVLRSLLPGNSWSSHPQFVVVSTVSRCSKRVGSLRNRWIVGGSHCRLVLRMDMRPSLGGCGLPGQVYSSGSFLNIPPFLAWFAIFCLRGIPERHRIELNVHTHNQWAFCFGAFNLKKHPVFVLKVQDVSSVQLIQRKSLVANQFGNHKLELRSAVTVPPWNKKQPSWHDPLRLHFFTPWS